METTAFLRGIGAGMAVGAVVGLAAWAKCTSEQSCAGHFSRTADSMGSSPIH